MQSAQPFQSNIHVASCAQRAIPQDAVVVNIAGRETFVVSRRSAIEIPLIETLLTLDEEQSQGASKENEHTALFFDRDPQTFAQLLRLVQPGGRIPPGLNRTATFQLRAEATFFGCLDTARRLGAYPAFDRAHAAKQYAAPPAARSAYVAYAAKLLAVGLTDTAARKHAKAMRISEAVEHSEWRALCNAFALVSPNSPERLTLARYTVAYHRDRFTKIAGIRDRSRSSDDMFQRSAETLRSHIEILKEKLPASEAQRNILVDTLVATLPYFQARIEPSNQLLSRAQIIAAAQGELNLLNLRLGGHVSQTSTSYYTFLGRLFSRE